MADENVDDKWETWQRGSARHQKHESFRETMSLWFSRFDWGMLIVPGVIVISAALVLWPLIQLGIL